MIYEYNCQECNHVQTEMRKIADRLEDGVCQECGATTKFKISTPDFRGSGGGWFGNTKNVRKTTTIDPNKGTVTHAKEQR